MIPAKGLAAALVLPLLSGCVAAAIPVLAAGGLVKTQTDSRSAPADTPPRVALPADPPALAGPANPVVGPVGQPAGNAPGAIVRDYDFADGTRITVTNSMGTGLSPPVVTAPPPVSVPADPGEPKVTYLAGVTSLPAPSSTASPARSPIPGSGYADFTSFAREQAAVPIAGAERISALLVDSSRLLPETRACSIHPSAVMIDLDPAGGMLDTAQPLAADPAFAAGLAELRSEGIEIGWVSGRTADRAGAIRKALAGAGLDPEGRDQLVLLRFPEERKQTRREDFAKANCVLAMAGDERADFDELFSYLRDPNAPTPVDALIGKRWFLVPPPLN